MGKGGEPRNSNFKPKIAKDKPNMALKRGHVTSNDSVLIFLKRPHRELQFETVLYRIGYLMKILKFDPSDLLKILVKLLKTAKNDQN